MSNDTCNMKIKFIKQIKESKIVGKSNLKSLIYDEQQIAKNVILNTATVTEVPHAGRRKCCHIAVWKTNINIVPHCHRNIILTEIGTKIFCAPLIEIFANAQKFVLLRIFEDTQL